MLFTIIALHYFILNSKNQIKIFFAIALKIVALLVNLKIFCIMIWSDCKNITIAYIKTPHITNRLNGRRLVALRGCQNILSDVFNLQTIFNNNRNHYNYSDAVKVCYCPEFIEGKQSLAGKRRDPSRLHRDYIGARNDVLREAVAV